MSLSTMYNVPSTNSHAIIHYFNVVIKILRPVFENNVIRPNYYSLVNSCTSSHIGQLVH